MSKSKEVVMLVTALSLAIAIIVQGSVFDNTRAMGTSLASLASAITHIQNDGKTITGNNPNRPSTPIIQQSSSNIIDTSFKNALYNLIPTPQLLKLQTLLLSSSRWRILLFKSQTKTPNPNLQVIINGNPLGAQSTRLGSGFVYDKQGHIITNSHVIDGANTADITFIDGNTYTAKVIGKDTSGDIALLQIIDNFSPENLFLYDCKFLFSPSRTASNSYR